MINQTEFSLTPKRRGFHLITAEILQQLPSPLPKTGILHLFVKHTSCALSINENADPDVRHDMEKIFKNSVDIGIPILSLAARGIPQDRDLHGLVHSW